MNNQATVVSIPTVIDLGKSSSASDNMEMNVNLASGTEDTSDGHMQISQQPFNATEIKQGIETHWKSDQVSLRNLGKSTWNEKLKFLAI